MARRKLGAVEMKVARRLAKGTAYTADELAAYILEHDALGEAWECYANGGRLDDLADLVCASALYGHPITLQALRWMRAHTADLGALLNSGDMRRLNELKAAYVATMAHGERSGE